MRLLRDSRYIIETVINDADLPFFFPAAFPSFAATAVNYLVYLDMISTQNFSVAAISLFLLHFSFLQIFNTINKCVITAHFFLICHLPNAL